MSEEKYEFGSEPWIAHAGRWVRNALAGHNLRELDVEFCEEFTDPPGHLAEGSSSIGWHLIIDGGRVTVGSGVIEARTKVVADYATMLPFARLVIDAGDGAQMAQVTELLNQATGDGKLTPPTGGTNPNLLPQLAGLHNEMAAHTR